MTDVIDLRYAARDSIDYNPGCYYCRMENQKHHAGVEPDRICVGHLVKRLRIAEGTEQQVQADSSSTPNSLT